MRGMKYRSDIDGLRAVAILPVVAYHAGLALVPGGFVGVDVFFVISGYLICRLINDEIKDGSFTVAAFYKRRVMRLFPALFAMLLATSVLAYLFLLPIELKEFSDSMIAAVTYVSNIFFALTPRVTSTRRRKPSRCCTPGRSRSRSSSTSFVRCSCWPATDFARGA